MHITQELSIVVLGKDYWTSLQGMHPDLLGSSEIAYMRWLQLRFDYRSTAIPLLFKGH